MIPEAVDATIKTFVPSIYQMCNCSVINPNEVTVSYDDIHNITLNDSIKFYIENSSNSLIGNVSTISSDTNTFTLSIPNNTVTNTTSAFLYGKEVNDFHSLKKEYIFTIATAAVQELDRQVQNLTVENMGM